MKKKIVSILVIAGLAVSLAACGSAPINSASSSQENQNEVPSSSSNIFSKDTTTDFQGYKVCVPSYYELSEDSDDERLEFYIEEGDYDHAARITASTEDYYDTEEQYINWKKNAVLIESEDDNTEVVSAYDFDNPDGGKSSFFAIKYTELDEDTSTVEEILTHALFTVYDKETHTMLRVDLYQNPYTKLDCIADFENSVKNIKKLD